MKQINESTVKIGPVRFSYMNVFATRHNSLSGKDEFSVTILIPKAANEFNRDPNADIEGARATAKAAVLRKFDGKVPAKMRECILDGDEETDADGNPKHPGYWFIRSRADADKAPTVVGPDANKVTGGWQSGDWGYAVIDFFGYDQKGSKGVSSGLLGVQFTAHDAPFGSSADISGAFEPVEDHDPFAEDAAA